MGPYAGDDYNLTLCLLQRRLQYNGNPMPESTLTLCQSRLYPPQSGPLILGWEINFWVLEHFIYQMNQHFVIFVTKYFPIFLS
jgi:hypothetical protein